MFKETKTTSRQKIPLGNRIIEQKKKDKKGSFIFHYYTREKWLENIDFERKNFLYINMLDRKQKNKNVKWEKSSAQRLYLRFLYLCCVCIYFVFLQSIL